MFSLAIRLSANIIAGHTLLHIIANLQVSLLKNLIWIAPFTFVLLFFIFILEIGVAFVQTYVFLMLTCLYINDAINIQIH